MSKPVNAARCASHAAEIPTATAKMMYMLVIPRTGIRYAYDGRCRAPRLSNGRNMPKDSKWVAAENAIDPKKKRPNSSACPGPEAKQIEGNELRAANAGRRYWFIGT